MGNRWLGMEQMYRRKRMIAVVRGYKLPIFLVHRCKSERFTFRTSEKGDLLSPETDIKDRYSSLASITIKWTKAMIDATSRHRHGWLFNARFSAIWIPDRTKRSESSLIPRSNQQYSTTCCRYCLCRQIRIYPRNRLNTEQSLWKASCALIQACSRELFIKRWQLINWIAPRLCGTLMAVDKFRLTAGSRQGEWAGRDPAENN